MELHEDSIATEEQQQPEQSERRPLLTRRELKWTLGGVLVGLLLLAGLVLYTGDMEAPPEMAQVNLPAPDFDLPTLDGQRVRLNQFRGKVVLVNFWASWCEPCKTEAPALARAYARLQGQGLEIIGIDLINVGGESREAVADFIAQYGVNYPIVLDERDEVQRAFKIYPIPVSYFIDANGIIRFIHNGELSEAEIDEAFNALRAP